MAVPGILVLVVIVVVAVGTVIFILVPSVLSMGPGHFIELWVRSGGELAVVGSDCCRPVPPIVGPKVTAVAGGGAVLRLAGFSPPTATVDPSPEAVGTCPDGLGDVGW